jgi:uncharacterized protein
VTCIRMQCFVPSGPTDRLVGHYPNLYGDLSAGSGYTALKRDPVFGLDFLECHQVKLLFGNAQRLLDL